MLLEFPCQLVGPGVYTSKKTIGVPRDGYALPV